MPGIRQHQTRSWGCGPVSHCEAGWGEEVSARDPRVPVSHRPARRPVAPCLGWAAAWTLACAGLLLGGALNIECSLAASARRIVSLNLCADQILLDLVARERIAGLSFLARDPTMSTNVEGARGIPAVQGSAEEVLALGPDLVLVGSYSTPATQSLLRRLGVRVAGIPMASSFEEIRAVVRQIAHETGDEAEGEALIVDFDRRLEAARAPRTENRPFALAYQVNSLASGPGSLLHEMIEAAGFRNLAADRTLGPGGRLPLESLVLDPPDLLIFANAPGDFRTVLGDNLRHPAVRYIAGHQASLHLPMPLWLCGTPRAVEAVERLAAARRDLGAGKRGP